MKLGINQLALLQKCRINGYITTGNVSDYYNFRGGGKLLGVLEKLEIQGYITTNDKGNGFVCQWRWVITEAGKVVLKENLGGFIKNGE